MFKLIPLIGNIILYVIYTNVHIRESLAIESNGYIMYCPCMGKLTSFCINFDANSYFLH